MFAIILFGIFNYGVKYRLYYNYIKHGRKLGLSERFDIDLEDIESYPKAVFEFYKEKQAYDKFIERKEERIKKVEDNFHLFAQKRMSKLAEERQRRGLRVKGFVP